MKVADLFDIYKGSKLDFGKQVLDEEGINFVSRNSNNNGVVGKVALGDNVKVYKKGDITVPLGGSFLLSAFVQNEDFVTAQNVHVLRPKKTMVDVEKWYYCYCLRMNRFKFSAFGREVNKYLKDIELPDKIPSWVYEASLKLPESETPSKEFDMELSEWVEFTCEELFDIDRGKLGNLNDIPEGSTPVVSAYGRYQGIRYMLDVPEEYENCLTVSFNGSGTGYCAYHQYGFNANPDCGLLIPKFNITPEIGIFLATLINHFAFKYMYGRKLTKSRLKKEKIPLPVIKDKNGDNVPDWNKMSDIIKGLRYSNIIK